MKEMTFHFCPVCGQYCRVEKKGRTSFILVSNPKCPSCNSALHMTGLAIMLINIVVSLPISMVLCAGATEVALGTFTGFSIIAVIRWIRQFRARRKYMANRTLGIVTGKPGSD